MIAGVEDPTIMEMIACREALALAENLNVYNLMIASDSKQTVQNIAEGSRGKHESVVAEINLRSSSFLLRLPCQRKIAQFFISRYGTPHLVGPMHDRTCIPHSGF